MAALLSLYAFLKHHGVKDYEHWMDFLLGGWCVIQIQAFAIWNWKYLRRTYSDLWRDIK